LFSHGFISGESSTCQRVPNWEDTLIISFRNSTYLACCKDENLNVVKPKFEELSCPKKGSLNLKLDRWKKKNIGHNWVVY
jgi:hypothetical protein